MRSVRKLIFDLVVPIRQQLANKLSQAHTESYRITYELAARRCASPSRPTLVLGRSEQCLEVLRQFAKEQVIGTTSSEQVSGVVSTKFSQLWNSFLPILEANLFQRWRTNASIQQRAQAMQTRLRQWRPNFEVCPIRAQAQKMFRIGHPQHPCIVLRHVNPRAFCLAGRTNGRLLLVRLGMLGLSSTNRTFVTTTVHYFAHNSATKGTPILDRTVHASINAFKVKQPLLNKHDQQTEASLVMHRWQTSRKRNAPKKPSKLNVRPQKVSPMADYGRVQPLRARETVSTIHSMQENVVSEVTSAKTESTPASPAVTEPEMISTLLVDLSTPPCTPNQEVRPVTPVEEDHIKETASTMSASSWTPSIVFTPTCAPPRLISNTTTTVSNGQGMPGVLPFNSRFSVVFTLPGPALYDQVLMDGQYDSMMVDSQFMSRFLKLIEANRRQLEQIYLAIALLYKYVPRMNVRMRGHDICVYIPLGTPIAKVRRWLELVNMTEGEHYTFERHSSQRLSNDTFDSNRHSHTSNMAHDIGNFLTRIDTLMQTATTPMCAPQTSHALFDQLEAARAYHACLHTSLSIYIYIMISFAKAS
jgi:hypothetical protein